MQTRIIILAAGRGTRMNPVRNNPDFSRDAVSAMAERISNGVNGHMPKVLMPFEGKPMIAHLLDAVRLSGADSRPVIVVGHGAEKVKSALGDGYEYVHQQEQLGTGHAVACAEAALRDKADQIIILYGDHPFIQASTITNLRSLHERERCPISLMTVRVEDFSDWRVPFTDFSRIIRDDHGRIIADVQVRDATPNQLAIHEVNPAFFCFDAAWLWPHLRLLTNDNVKEEYYLTDLVRMAMSEGACIASLSISPEESIGVNTPEHLEIAKRLFEKLIV